MPRMEGKVKQDKYMLAGKVLDEGDDLFTESEFSDENLEDLY